MRISDWSSDVCSSDLNSVNPSVPANIDLVCGDPLLELQSNAVNTLANNQIPGSNPWIAVVDWISDFLAKIDGEYDVVFMDCNPSFSLYTQIALSSCNRIVLPVMADDSSRRAIQNVFSLLYGLKQIGRALCRERVCQ